MNPEATTPSAGAVFRRVLPLAYRLGLLAAPHRLWPNRLTVLAYHRIADASAAGFDTFAPTASATPRAFAAQMDFVTRHFSVVSAGDLIAWLGSGRPLPRYPALITFDDGYRDLVDNALPVLRERRLPAVVFLTTGHIGSAAPFYWDLAAYCFHHTARHALVLPGIGRWNWSDERARGEALRRCVAALKQLPDDQRREAQEALPEALGVAVPAEAFRGLYLTWEDARAALAAGIDLGAHTVTHSILTRIPPERARAEILDSRRMIEAQTGRPVHTFAYPNGEPGDFDASHQALLAELGFAAAFTLLPGPATFAEVRRDPFAIRRVFVGRRDDMPRFVAKAMGWARLLGLAR
jgi:peptidoglycan/xylan/chitin deacetylase (PgdA/CDA1 family)